MTVLRETTAAAASTDEQLVQAVLGGDQAVFELLMRRYNQRVFRACRAILRDYAEAEDVAQDAYVRAYEHLSQFQGRASFSTWLTRIAVNEALARVRKRRRMEEMDAMPETRRDALKKLSSPSRDPVQNAAGREASTLLERSIDRLPDLYREVFVLRDVEQMSTSDTADALEISEESVKTRLHRARALLRRELYRRVGATSASAFQFLGARCERLVVNVMARINELPRPARPGSSRLLN